jgi:phosphoribosylglycinamide formyltransferase-1
VDGRIRGAEIAVVLSNKPEAPGLDAARSLGLKARAIAQEGKGPEARAAHDARMISALKDYEVDLVCLAGYMRIITPAFVEAFPNRILNVHPSLLPAFPGLEAQHQAFDYGVKVAGCTVHFVDEAVDHGVIVLQKTVLVLDEDTAEALAARILEQEHIAYPEAIVRVLSGGYRVEGRRYLPVK